MRRFAAILACLALPVLRAQAQIAVDPNRLSTALRNLEAQPDEQRLKCSVAEIRPALNFGFRFQAGYTVRVPMQQYQGKGHRWSILLRVTPESGKPVHLLSRYRLPEIPKTNQEMEIGGGFLVGEGKYQVAWKLQDESGRVCRAQWKFEARLKRSESKVKVAMAPNTADSFANWTVGRHTAIDDAAPIRLTVLMHAAPSNPRRVRISARDRVLLLGTLDALLERVPTRSVRVVLFNLDQQKELYRQDDFHGAQFYELSRALDGLELATVDYRVLRNGRGHVDLLADLLNQEVEAPQPSDVVLFLGPLSRLVERMPEAVLERPPGDGPRFLYFQYRPPFMRMEATLPDLIHSAVSKLRGKTLVIHTPGDFAKAIDQMEHGR